MGALKVQLVAFKRQHYTQNDVKMAILVSRVRTTGELAAPLNNTLGSPENVICGK